MINFESLNLSQLQTALNTVKGQIATYQALYSTAKVQYNNCMSMIFTARTKLSNAKQQITNTIQNVSGVQVDSILPSDLLEVPNTSPDIAINNIETAGLQVSKNNAQDKINKFKEKIDKLKQWQTKIENKIQELQTKVEQLQADATNIAIQKSSQLLNTMTSKKDQLITKATTGTTNKVQTTITKIPYDKVLTKTS